MAQDARWETLPAALLGVSMLGIAGGLGMALGNNYDTSTSSAHGACDQVIEAVQRIEEAPITELDSAINAVYEADMQCRSS